MSIGINGPVDSLAAAMGAQLRIAQGQVEQAHVTPAAPRSFAPEAFVPSLQLVESGLLVPMQSSTQAVSFADMVFGTEAMPVDYDVGLLCVDVGLDESAGPDSLNGWERVTHFPEGQQPPPPFTLDPETGIITDPNGTRGAAYQRGGEPPEIIMVYAGSNDPMDYATDAEIAGGMIPGQTMSVVNLAEWMVGMYPGQVIFGGHSLGGSHAAASALATGAPAITFNSAGINPAILDYVTALRNQSAPGTEKSSEQLLDEAEEGQVRNHKVEGDWLSGVQEAEKIPTGHLTVAVGHHIEAERKEGISQPWDNHFMDSAINALGAGSMIVGVEGDAVTVAYPEPRNELVIVTFDESPAGEAAQNRYSITGVLPDDMVGVREVRVTPFAIDSGTAIVNGPTETVSYDGAGNRTGETIERPGLVIRNAVGANGEEDVDARLYEYTLSPADEAEAMQLNVLFGEDPHDGPFQPGQTSTVILTHAEMQDVESDMAPVPGGGEVNVLLEGDGDAGKYDSTTDFALGLVDAPTSSVGDLLSVIRANAGRADEPITAVIVPADGP